MLNLDRPIKSCEDDRLGYLPFAEALAKTIARQPIDDGLVIGINGPWGAGKTSTVNMAIEKLKAIELSEGKGPEHQTIVYRFEPWLHRGRDALIVEYFAGLGHALDKPLGYEIGQAVRNIGSSILSRSNEIMGATAILIDGAGGAGVASAGLRAAKEVSKLTTVDRGKDSLLASREKLRTLLYQQHRRIVVVIDDIDRLDADEAKAMLGMVKSVADLPGVIYILPMDIKQATLLVHGNQSQSNSFLEKIIQVTLDLPRASTEGIARQFLDSAEKIFKEGDSEYDESDWEWTCGPILEGYLTTPRRVTRLVNRIRVSFAACSKETYFPDLVGIEAIREFEPLVYDYVMSNRQALANARSFEKETVGEIKKFIQEHLIEKKQGLSLMKQLFPSLGRSTSTMFGFLNWAGRRVSDPAGVDAYFLWGLEPGKVSFGELKQLQDEIDKDGEIDKLVARIASQKSIHGVRASNGMLDAITEKRIVDKAPNFRLLTSIVQAEELITDIPVNADWFPSSGAKLRDAIRTIALGVTDQRLADLIERIVLAPETTIRAGAKLIESLTRWNPEEDELLSAEAMNEIIENWMKSRVSPETDPVNKGQAAGRIARIVRDNLGKETAKRYVNTVTDLPAACTSIALSLMSRVNSSARPGIYYEMTSAPDPEVYDLGKIVETLESTDITALDDTRKAGILTFIQSVKRIQEGTFAPR